MTERKLSVGVFLVVAVALGLAAGAVFAQPGPVNPVPAGQPQPASSRYWHDVADIGLRVATLLILSVGIIGTFGVLTSHRSHVYTQIFSRFQSMLLKLSEHPDLFDKMKREEYKPDEFPTSPCRFLANAMVNLYEEAFLLHQSRILGLFEPVQTDYWQSMLGSMRAAFQLRYVRTHWEKRQDVFSSKFNTFARTQILGERPA
jgi:hypothetical protein